ncbi:MAG: hypothetical protein QOG63_509 [Thermoleophilaceae bacterium]|jgi:hypothetical protein|nr:hypothetical protein [Thermoleophilaceae bacterium]
MRTARIALAAVAVLAFAAGPAEARRHHKPFVAAKLQPLSGHTEEGIVLLALHPKATKLSFALNFGGIIMELRLSSRTCDGVQRHPDRPRFVGPKLARIDGARDGGFGHRRIAPVPRARLHHARSLVLVADDGPRACGRALGLTLNEVLVSN